MQIELLDSKEEHERERGRIRFDYNFINRIS